MGTRLPGSLENTLLTALVFVRLSVRPSGCMGQPQRPPSLTNTIFRLMRFKPRFFSLRSYDCREPQETANIPRRPSFFLSVSYALRVQPDNMHHCLQLDVEPGDHQETLLPGSLRRYASSCATGKICGLLPKGDACGTSALSRPETVQCAS